MPDEPTSSNSGRISAMLNDLATQRNQGQNNLSSTAQPTVPSRPPPNLPTAPASVPLGVTPMPRPSAPPPVAPRPAPMPAQQPVPPRPPMPQTPASPRPPAPPVAPTPSPEPVKAQSEPYTTELRTMSADIGRISTGQPIGGTKPAAPSVPPTTPTLPTPPIISKPNTPATPTPIIPSTISAPTESGSGLGRKILIGILGITAVSIIFWLVSMMLGESTPPEISPSPSLSPVATLAPTTKTLSSYFAGSTTTISASEYSQQINANVRPEGGSSVVLDITQGTAFLSAIEFLEITRAGAGTVLASIAGPDQKVLAYGQKEHFTAQGAPNASAPIDSRLVFIIEVTDISEANTIMSETFEKIPQDGCGDFNSGNYKQVAVRYRNCPYADLADDFAIVLASNNKNYLVISRSRESMFHTIDQLMK